jgi:Sensors of blue-light using FAD
MRSCDQTNKNTAICVILRMQECQIKLTLQDNTGAWGERAADTIGKRQSMPLIRLIYRSENAMHVGGSRIYVHFHDIVATARRNNENAQICGFLMFDRQRFHQILEGPEDKVLALFGRISADSRHRNIEILERVPIPQINFLDWSMGAFLSDTNAHPLYAKYGIRPGEPVDGQVFLKFATDFVNLEPETA